MIAFYILTATILAFGVVTPQTAADRAVRLDVQLERWSTVHNATLRRLYCDGLDYRTAKALARHTATCETGRS